MVRKIKIFKSMKQELLAIKKSLLISRRGFSLVEAVVAVAVFSIFIGAAATNLILPHKYIFSSGLESQAVHLSQEGLEATRNIRDSDFANLSDGNHGLVAGGTAWSFSGTQDATDIFTRKIKISTINENTKEVESEIAWNDKGQAKTLSLKERLTNWRAIAGWMNPSAGACLDFSGGQDGVKVQVDGDYAFALTASASSSLIVVDISNPDNPSAKTNVPLQANPNNIAISGNYAYIASSHNSEEMQDIDINDPENPSKSGAYNASGNSDAKGIDVSGLVAYLVRSSSGDDEFFTLNVSSPNSPSKRDSLNLNSAGNEVIKLGNYAYVATNDSGGELKVIDVSNPASLSIAGTYNLSGNVTLLTVAGFGNTVLAGGSNGNLYVFDVSSPASPILRGQFSAGGSVNDIAVKSDGTLAFLATSNGSQEFQLINISDVTNPSFVASVDMSGSLNGVAYDEEKNIAVTIGASNTEEFCIVAP